MHGQHDGREVAGQMLVDHAAGHLQRDPRLEAGLEVGAQRVAHERGAGERLAAVARNVAEDERGAPAGQRERVVEVTAGAGTVRGPVGHRGADGAHGCGHRREQRGLEQADLLEQVAALARQPPAALGQEQVAAAEHERRGSRAPPAAS